MWLKSFYVGKVWIGFCIWGFFVEALACCFICFAPSLYAKIFPLLCNPAENRRSFPVSFDAFEAQKVFISPSLNPCGFRKLFVCLIFFFLLFMVFFETDL